ncbi:hypothetical protein AB0I72_27585 [Nocardiopsis sp. NPDC049922]|uniref:hypothetical protein n=1 Tax=Nocardiopsis sp. NPDC049922 TaxID=3155157 RepID=UPI0033CAB7A7
MPERIDAILTEYPGYGWSIESPQLPELVGGRDTREELEVDLTSLLKFGGAQDPFVPAVHWQKYLIQDEEAEVAIRVRRDQHVTDRMQVARRIGAALKHPDQRRSMSNLPQRSTGEVLFVCSVAQDRLDTLARQLDPRGDTFMIAVAVADNMLYTTALSNRGNGQRRSGWVRIADLGWDENTTVGDLVRYQQTSGKRDLQLLA